MAEVREGFFGEEVAVSYDERSAAMFEPAVVAPVVDLLASFVGEGGALEFAIGTGRIALPLAARGVRVHDIDSSEAMVGRLRVKPGADAIGVTIGDLSTTRVDAEFTVVYLVFNTIFNLVTQDTQVASFENAAAHMRSGGRLVLETGVPASRACRSGRRSSRSAPTRTSSGSTCRRHHAAVQLAALGLHRGRTRREVPRRVRYA